MIAIAEQLGLDLVGDGRRLAELDEAQVYGVMLKNARVTYDELASAGKHGLPTPHNIGWFHEKVLAGRGWRIAPEVMLERLAGLQPSHDDGALLVPGRVLYATNSVEFPPDGMDESWVGQAQRQPAHRKPRDRHSDHSAVLLSYPRRNSPSC